MKAILLLTTALGFMSETCEVVLANRKGHDGPVRVSKHEFDADQEKDAGDRQFSKYSGKDEPDQSATGATSALPFDALDGVRVQAAPSAPNFNGGREVNPLPIDEEKNAVAPAVPSENSYLVMKEGKTFYIVDGLGVKWTGERAGGLIEEDGYKSEAAARAAIAALPR